MAHKITEIRVNEWMRTLTKYLISIVSISIALYRNTVIKEESIIDKITLAIQIIAITNFVLYLSLNPSKQISINKYTKSSRTRLNWYLELNATGETKSL